MTQGTLFDEQMRVQAERATWWAEDMRRQLTAAEARITALERERDALQESLRKAEHDLETTIRLRLMLDGLRGSAPGEGDRDRLIKSLTHLAAEVHPDRWQGSPVAEECTKAVLHLRATLMQ